MNRIPPSTRPADRVGFPWDLTEWVDGDTLRQWIQQEIDAFDWSNPLLVRYLQTHPDYRPKTLLALLLYAYAAGVHASEDIAALCYSSPVFRSIAGPTPPTVADIQEFRRENRGLLKRSLQQILLRSLRQHYALGDGFLAPGLRPYIEKAAVTRLDLARHLDRAAQAP